MVREIWEAVREFLGRVLRSRLFPISVAFLLMFAILFGRLFNLQIVSASEYQDNYVQKTLATIPLTGTRGNIYDCNGLLLAGNELTYNVTFRDTGAYTTHQEKNAACLQIVNLMQDQEETLSDEIPVQVDEHGNYVFSTMSSSKIRRFLVDLMGNDAIAEEAEKGVDVYAWTADDVVSYMEDKYYLGSFKDEAGNPVSLTKEETLGVLNIRYKLTLTSYTKYQPVLVAENVSAETVAAALEYSSEIEGLDVEESAVRVYPYGEYCSSIIGYTKSADEDELAALQEAYPEVGYTSGDIIGKGGIEEEMEAYLQGSKGSETVYLDSQGQILSVVSIDEPEAGMDVYLNIDIEQQIGIYELLEQMIAGILVQHIVIDDEVEEQENPDIPVKDVYVQLISNRVLDSDAFSDIDASEPEQQMYAAFESEYEEVTDWISDYLTGSHAVSYNRLTDEQQTYIDFIYSDLLMDDWGILKTGDIDRNNETYQAYREGTTDLATFLRECVMEGWIDFSGFENDGKYASTEELYASLADGILEKLEDNLSFNSLIYEYLIRNNVISGNQVCAALYSQGVLAYDETQYNKLLNGSRKTAYKFIVGQISEMNITPAMLALDPCSGAVVVTDVDTGKVLSVVNYPSYDNNYFSGTVDAVYYDSLLSDQSLPLYNRATQTALAPGSTFKMVTMAAALEEEVMDPYETVDCTVVYDKVTPSPSCWNENGHGPVNIWDALAGSCNFYFYEVGYRLSLTEDGDLNSEQGVDTLAKYAEMFGLDQKSGIEMTEVAPKVSDTESIASSIGQGTHAYSTVGLARYVTAIASRGNVYQLSLLDSVVTKEGKTEVTYDPVILQTVDLQDETWDIIQEAMYDVPTYGSIRGYLSDSPVLVAAKTGTAQEDLTRAEHSQFVSFAPYEDPEITVTITIVNGYTSGNNARLANQIYQFLYGEITLDEIAEYGAFELDGSTVVGD